MSLDLAKMIRAARKANKRPLDLGKMIRLARRESSASANRSTRRGSPASTDQRWNKVASDLLAGRTIVGVRYMTTQEAKQLDWKDRALLLALDDGTVLYASQDEEGNGPGALFGRSGDTDLTFPTL